MRVLLVEDEKGISSAICQVLKKENFSVDPVYTGTDGLDYALAGIYDAIILDVMLPGMDGFQVLSALRREGIKTPFACSPPVPAWRTGCAGWRAGRIIICPSPSKWRN